MESESVHKMYSLTVRFTTEQIYIYISVHLHDVVQKLEVQYTIQGGPKKLAQNFLYALTLPNSLLTDSQNYFTVRIRRKFVIILSLKITPHVKCVATLPCEMSVS